MRHNVKANNDKVIAKVIATVLFAGFLASTASAQVMTSASYRMQSDSVNVGGGLSSSATYALEDTAGEIATGRSSSAAFAAHAGYQQSSTSSAPDLVAPSVPSNVSASGLSSSAIGIVWNPSTDNVGVASYRVYRNGTLVATVAITSYTDTGLAPSTAYSYTVTAVDAANNESAHSAPAAATTFAATVPPPARPSGGGLNVIAPLRIYDVRTYAGTSFADVQWKTDRPAVSTVSWGTTPGYEGGSVAETAHSLDHRVRVDGLAPGTAYYVRVVSTDADGRIATTELRVRTYSGADVEPPANVSGFSAVGEDGAIRLGWKNPKDLDFESVRIVRSDKFFPNGINDGKTVYEGRAESFVDSDVENGKTYYYAAFAKDASGNWSSGAVASAKPTGEAVPNPFDYLPPAPAVDPKIEKLTLRDFKFTQNGSEALMVGDDRVYIDGLKNLKISLDYGKVPEVLKTIAVTFVHPNDAERQFTFLLKVNADKTAYEAMIGALEIEGVYGVRIAILDHKNRGLKKLEGNMLAAVGETVQGGYVPADKVAVVLMVQITKAISLIFILVLLLLAAIESMRKGRERKARRTEAK